MSLITKIFGTYSEKQIKKIIPIVDKIESLDAEYTAMSDDDLRGKTAESSFCAQSTPPWQ